MSDPAPNPPAGETPAPRWPWHIASRLAVELSGQLAPHCAPAPDLKPPYYCVIAGSLRRMKANVGDIEIVYVPARGDILAPGEMFSKPGNLADREIERWLEAGAITKRLNVTGAATWGERIKLATHVATGIPVDLFSIDAAGWASYLVCRTGPMESNVAICNAAIARGWKWEPYQGFRHLHSGETFIPKTEAEVFGHVGLPFRKPHERK